MEAAGYSLDLYCDGPDHFDKSPPKITSVDDHFYGQTYGEVKRDAKKAGWTYTRDGKQICKYCSGKVKYNVRL